MHCVDIVFLGIVFVCKEAVVPKQSWYHGRSQRTLYTRQSEHCHGFESKKLDNALYKHTLLHHPDVKPKFVFQVEKFFSDAISAQIFEGICINNSQSDPGYLQNSRSEYEQGNVARIVVSRGLNE